MIDNNFCRLILVRIMMVLPWREVTMVHGFQSPIIPGMVVCVRWQMTMVRHIHRAVLGAV